MPAATPPPTFITSRRNPTLKVRQNVPLHHFAPTRFIWVPPLHRRCRWPQRRETLVRQPDPQLPASAHARHPSARAHVQHRKKKSCAACFTENLFFLPSALCILTTPVHQPPPGREVAGLYDPVVGTQSVGRGDAHHVCRNEFVYVLNTHCSSNLSMCHNHGVCRMRSRNNPAVCCLRRRKSFVFHQAALQRTD